MSAGLTPADAAPGADSTAQSPAGRWSAVFAMALCVFALIASEFMPVSLLTPMAADLGVSEGLAGQGIAISGAFAVVASLCLATVARQVDRRTLLLCLTALMCLSGAVIGWAPNYTVYMVGRALIGVVVGGFWSLSAAVALRLVPAPQVPRALAIFNGGNALATVVAAPLGSYLGATIGWRGAFLCLVPVGLAVLAWQWVSLPPLPPRARTSGAHRSAWGLLRDRRVAVGMLAVGAFFLGQFMLFTYVRPFLEGVTHVGAYTLTLVLLVVGGAGLVGTTAMGLVVQRSLYGTLAAAPLCMAGIAVALIGWGAQLLPVVALLGAWGMIATATPVGWWSWLAQTLPDDAEAGGGLMVAVVQLSIALGSTAGGLLFDTHGHQATFATSAAVLVVSAALVGCTARLYRQRG